MTTAPQYMWSPRLTNLEVADFITLLQTLKIEHGRFINEVGQIETSYDRAVIYEVPKAAQSSEYASIDMVKGASLTEITKDQIHLLARDEGRSKYRRAENILQYDIAVTESGYDKTKLQLNIPKAFAVTMSNDKQFYRFTQRHRSEKYSFFERMFPVGQFQLWPLKPKATYQLTRYFDNKSNPTFEQIIQFYKRFGQYILKQFMVGIKHTKLGKWTGDKTTTQQKESTTRKAAIKYSMMKVGQEAQHEQKRQNIMKTTDQRKRETQQVCVVGGINILHDKYEDLVNYIKDWRTWRIIDVTDYQSIHWYLPKELNKKIYRELNSRYEMKKLEALTLDLILNKCQLRWDDAPKFYPSIGSRVVCEVDGRLLQLIPYTSCYMVIVSGHDVQLWCKKTGNIVSVVRPDENGNSLDRMYIRKALYQEAPLQQQKQRTGNPNIFLPVNTKLAEMVKFRKIVGCAVYERENGEGGLDCLYIVEETMTYQVSLDEMKSCLAQLSQSDGVILDKKYAFSQFYRHHDRKYRGKILGKAWHNRMVMLLDNGIYSINLNQATKQEYTIPQTLARPLMERICCNPFTNGPVLHEDPHLKLRIHGNWKHFHPGIVNNKLYAFGNGLYCVDLETWNYQKISDRKWYGGHPATCHSKAWNILYYEMYEITLNEIRKIKWAKQLMSEVSFHPDSPVCALGSSATGVQALYAMTYHTRMIVEYRLPTPKEITIGNDSQPISAYNMPSRQTIYTHNRISTDYMIF